MVKDKRATADVIDRTGLHDRHELISSIKRSFVNDRCLPSSAGMVSMDASHLFDAKDYITSGGPCLSMATSSAAPIMQNSSYFNAASLKNP